MTAIDTDIGFDAVFRKSATELKLRLARDAETGNYQRPARSRDGFATYAVFGGLGILSLGIFVIGCSALRAESPEVWIHRLMALALLQSILIGAATMKLLPLIERRSSLVRIGARTERLHMAQPLPKTNEVRTERVPPPLPAPPKPVIGQLAGRDFLEYSDGSIEIDTMIGRRRFISLDAAREFVGT
jgi:hypothetical protein